MNPENDTPKPYEPQPSLPEQPQAPSWQPAPDTIVDREPSTEGQSQPVSVAGEVAASDVDRAREVPVMAPASVSPASRRSKKPLFAGIAIGAAVLLLGGGVAAYQLWYQNPDKVVTDSLVKAITAKTMSYTGTIDASGESGVRAELKGAMNDAAFTTAAKVTLTSGAMSIVVDGDVQTHKNGDMYFKVKNAKDLSKSFFTMSGMASNEAIDAFIAKIDNKWVKLTTKDLDSQTESTATSCMTDAVAKVQDDAAMRREVTDAYAKQRFIAVKESLGEKNGSLGYKLDVDEAKTKAFVGELKKTKLYGELQKCDKNFTLDEKDLTSDQKGTTTTVELWANKWTHELTKLTVGMADKTEKATIVAEPTFNKPVTITAPTDVLTFDQLKDDVANLMTSLMGSAGLSADTAGMTQAEMSAMETQLMGADVEQ